MLWRCVCRMISTAVLDADASPGEMSQLTGSQAVQGAGAGRGAGARKALPQIGAGIVKSEKRNAARAEAVAVVRRATGWQLLSRMALPVFDFLSGQGGGAGAGEGGVEGEVEGDEGGRKGVDWMLEALQEALYDLSPTIRKRAQFVLSLAASPAGIAVRDGWREEMAQGGEAGDGGGHGGRGLLCAELGESVGWGVQEWATFLAMLDAADNSAPHYLIELWPRLPSLLPAAKEVRGGSAPDGDGERKLARGKMWMLEALFRMCVGHRSHALRLRLLHSLASDMFAGNERRLSMGFISDLLVAMDEPALLKFCGLNASNPAAPLGARRASWADIRWESVCKADFGAEYGDKGGVESGDARPAPPREVAGVQAFELILRRNLMLAPRRQVGVGDAGRGGGGGGGETGDGGAGACDGEEEDVCAANCSAGSWVAGTNRRIFGRGRGGRGSRGERARRGGGRRGGAIGVVGGSSA
jgi:hypothetical protein